MLSKTEIQRLLESVQGNKTQLDCRIKELREKTTTSSNLEDAQKLCCLLNYARKHDEMSKVYKDHIYPHLKFHQVPALPKCDSVKAKKVLVIYFFGRSGSMFLSTLFDSHPQVLGPAIGFEHIPWLYSKCSNGSFTTFLAMLAIPSNHVFNIESIFTSNYFNVSRERFISTLKEIVTQKGWLENDHVKPANLFLALNLAYMICKEIPFVNGPCVVLFHAHQYKPEKSRFITRNFSDFQQIFIVRSPFESLASHFIQTTKDRSHDPRLLASKYSFGANLFTAYSENFDTGKVNVVRLEDLKRDPRSMMKQFCELMSIDFTDSLLKSTIAGADYSFPGRLGKVKGFEQKHLKQSYRKDFSWLDEARLKSLLSAHYRAWAYVPLPFPCYHLMKPFLLPLFLFPFRFEIIQFKLNWKGKLLREAFFDALSEYIRVRRLFFKKTIYDTILKKTIIHLLN